MIVLALAAALAGFTLSLSHPPPTALLLLFYVVYSLVLFPLVLLHEAGHALAARLVRAPAYAIVVGHEPWIVDRYFLGIRWRLGKYPGGGLTYHEPCEGENARARNIFIIAAGPVTNLLVALLAWVIAAWVPDSFAFSLGKPVLLTVGVASAVQAVLSLWPRMVSTSAGKIPNDAANILRLWRGALDPPEPGCAVKYYFRATFALTDQSYPECIQSAALAQEAWQDPDFSSAMSVLRAAALCEADDAPGAIALLEPLERSDLANFGTRAGVADILSWAYLLQDDPHLHERGLELVTNACEIAPWEAAFAISKACLLAISATEENARAAAARGLLARFSPKEFTRPCAAYSALASGFIAIAERDSSAARRQLVRARELGATAAPLRLLEWRLASP